MLDGYAGGAVEDVQGVVAAVGDVGESDPLEKSAYIGGNSELLAVFADDLENALPGRVVTVFDVEARLGLGGLVAEGRELVGVVPFEESAGGFADHVAARIVGILVSGAPAAHSG